MLEVDGLQVELVSDAGIVRAIDGVRLSIRRGETFALVGESGCGKSMTALALMRLLPENGVVVGGAIALGGDDGGDRVDVLDLPEARMRDVRGARIGMIFQEPATSLNPVMRIGRQIVEAIESHTPLRGDAARAKAIDWLRRVGIPDPESRIDEYPFRMSGGQKQRVMIAVALAAEPDFLIADEPTTALDVTIQAQILELLKDLQRERRMGMLLITHDLAVVSGMAQRVALMYAGQIVEVAPAAEFFSAPKHPYARALLRALPGGERRGAELQAIPGTVPALTQAFAGCRYAGRCDREMPHCASTPPPLFDVGPDHVARCLLYEPGSAGARGDDVPRTDGAVVRAGAPDGRPVGADGGADARAGVPTRSGTGDGRAASTAAAASPPARTAPGEPLLVVDDLRVRFPIRRGLMHRVRGHFDAIAGVSLEIGAGETLALVGESGCGKTTIGKAIVQLLRGVAVTTGRVRLAGTDLFAAHGAELLEARRRVQIVFQDPFASLNPRMRVAEVLEEGLLSLQPELDAAQRRERVERIAGRVGLRREALQRFPHEFSGGQRQRIAIARALAVEPRLIVCDEPTSALDVSVQAQILNLLRELQRELGVSYLFITHNIGVVEYIADRVAVMRAGRIEEQGRADDVLRRPAHDYTRALLAAVPRLVTA